MPDGSGTGKLKMARRAVLKLFLGVETGCVIHTRLVYNSITGHGNRREAAGGAGPKRAAGEAAKGGPARRENGGRAPGKDGRKRFAGRKMRGGAVWTEDAAQSSG